MVDDFIGKLIDRKYRLLSELGRGAMGIVYRAEQLDAEGRARRIVAVKTLKTELSQDAGFARRFLREVGVSMQLRGPHVLTVYDSGKDDTGQLYYVMEFMAQTLKEFLHERGPLPVEQSVAITCQICEGLAEAHSLPEPVIHRDIKPANVFIENRQGRLVVKIGDFGIAKVLSEHTTGLTHTGQASPGTPRYMAPEQWLGEEAIDGRADLYSVGILLYEMLTGQPPFSGPIPVLMGQHLQLQPPPLPEAIPAGVRKEVERLLAKDRNDRPSDGLRVQAALAAALLEEQGTVLLSDQKPPGMLVEEPRDEVSDSDHLISVREKNTGDHREQCGPPAEQEKADIARTSREEEPKTDRVRAASSSPRFLSRRNVVAVITSLIVLLVGRSYFTTQQQRSNEQPQQQTPVAQEQEAQPHAEVNDTESAEQEPEEETGVAESPVGEESQNPRATRETVAVPAGDFFMGCNDAVDKQCNEDEKPGRRVLVDGFKIDKTEVTVAEYRECVEAGKCSVPSHTGPACNWQQEGKASHPMNCVNWHHAAAFCRWDGNKRLPTEAEWEKAARGTDGRVYPWGNEWNATNANVDGKADGFGQTAAVGSFSVAASPYGALDMAGNVWEWVQDWYDEQYYRDGARSNPQGPENGDRKVLRGGSWFNAQGYARTAARFWPMPGLRRGSIGFRCAQ